MKKLIQVCLLPLMICFLNAAETPVEKAENPAPAQVSYDNRKLSAAEFESVFRKYCPQIRRSGENFYNIFAFNEKGQECEPEMPQKANVGDYGKISGDVTRIQHDVISLTRKYTTEVWRKRGKYGGELRDSVEKMKCVVFGEPDIKNITAHRSYDVLAVLTGSAGDEYKGLARFDVLLPVDRAEFAKYLNAGGELCKAQQKKETCVRCSGSGKVEDPLIRRKKTGLTNDKTACSDCKGTGARTEWKKVKILAPELIGK